MLLGTWNLENLYRPGGPYGPDDEAAYASKLAALAAVITELDPGLLGVQEVGDPGALEDLAGMLDDDWHVALSSHADSRGIRVGFLSRTELTVVADTAAFPPRMLPVQADDTGLTVSQAGRGFLAVEVAGERGPLRVAVCHLKSKLLSYPDGRFQPRDEGERARYGAYALYRRAAEAAALRALADRLLEGDGRERDVAVLGDLNDEVQAATTQMLLGPPGSEIGTPGYERPDRGDAVRLWDVAPLIPASERYSRVNSGRRELIDHVLLSHRLVRRVSAAGTGLPDDGPPRLPSVGADPGERRGVAGSDHAPVWVRVV
ncbi:MULTISPECIES: endonuclease/exonuclease/phosphatase family protein [Streptomyces]|uniref:Extracellular nuclease n=1 Tax=Streptomyces thermodiastaticus TaxID=44061 RepID=A0ABU0KGC7_9ACTN|nr:putative extracellular nuclease [Streptomyces thermodiastaticus]MXQ57273.1 endonuclease [Streptomyces sp. XHT-2]UVT09232.1 endonuclease/exonuclease/phosphatase family protein [Streptomyces thermocarboxydus]WSB40881.1 endonuclease/exonuclease/phosphatase family protein [Streptomyces cellulosae]WSB50462.1 endonuclease/exonuclease/phosphatase family protein [Streptomyces cellulosae]